MTTFTAPNWFNLKNYSAAGAFNFKDWARHIGNRHWLQSLLERGDSERFDQEMARIAADPFTDLGFDYRAVSARTVYPLTVQAAKSIVGALANTEINGASSCDEVVEIQSEAPPGTHIHLTINLEGSLTQLTSDFRAAIRPALDRYQETFPRKRAPGITKKKRENWHKYHVLAYLDINMWAQRMALELTNMDVLTTLYLETNETIESARTTIRLADDALSLTTIRQLAHAR